MIVSELITQLQKFRGTLRVVTGGFDEAGLDDVVRCELVKVRFDTHPNQHTGAHSVDPNGEEAVLVDF